MGFSERALIDRAIASFLPVKGTMEISPLCNLRCNMCYVREDSLGAGKEILNGGEWLRIGKSAAEAGVLFVLLTGGEPLLHPDFRKIYLGLREMGLIISLNTNGTLIDEEWADFFAENPCREVCMTLYGACPETYGKLCHDPNGFERTINAVKLLQERQITVHMRISIVRENMDEVEDMLKILEDLGIEAAPVFYMFPPRRDDPNGDFEKSRMSPEEAAHAKTEYIFHRANGRSRQDEARFYLDPIKYPPEVSPYGKGYPCPAGRSSFWVDWRGRLSSCSFIPEPYADLREVSFADGWKEVVAGVKCAETCRKCHECRKRILCKTCAAAMYTETGDMKQAPEYLCRMTDEMIKIMFSYLDDAEKADTRDALEACGLIYDF